MHKICTFVRTLAKSYKAKNIYDKKGEEEERCWKQKSYFYHHFDGIFFHFQIKNVCWIKDVSWNKESEQIQRPP